MVDLFAHSEQERKTLVRHLRRDRSASVCYPSAMILRVRELRTAKGLTVEELAARVGISKGYLSEIERGVKVVNSRRMDQLAAALECRPSDLLADQSVSNDLRAHLDLLAKMDEAAQREVFQFARFRARGDG
jgi:transcriptional regulator with XRE-family HTH domain